MLQRFLEVGHTQADGDSMHALIEKAASKTEIFTQSGWARIMAECKSENPYEVNQRTQEEIFNFDDLSKQCFNWKPAKLATLREIIITPGSKYVEVKHDFFKPARRINVFKRDVTIEQVCDFKLQKMYSERIKLSQKKNDDLKFMLENNLIPQDCKTEFKSMLNE